MGNPRKHGAATRDRRNAAAPERLQSPISRAPLARLSCPRCSSTDVRWHSKRATVLKDLDNTEIYEDRHRYKCNNCGKYYTDYQGAGGPPGVQYTWGVVQKARRLMLEGYSMREISVRIRHQHGVTVPLSTLYEWGIVWLDIKDCELRKEAKRKLREKRRHE